MRPGKALIAIVLLGSGGLVCAQDAEDIKAGDAAISENQNDRQQKIEKKAPAKNAPEPETPDSFEATEQLSEDIAADFPVDI